MHECESAQGNFRSPCSAAWTMRWTRRASAASRCALASSMQAFAMHAYAVHGALTTEPCKGTALAQYSCRT
jgi:hypothetical protein